MLRALRTLRPRTQAATSGRFPAPVESVLPPASCVLYPPWRSSPVRALQLCSALCAGHNKWSKVKHIKGPKDEARGRMFMKFGMMIKVAVKGEIKQLAERKRPLNYIYGGFFWLISVLVSHLQRVDPTQT